MLAATGGTSAFALPAFIVSVVAILLSFLTNLFVWGRNRNENRAQFLSGLWNETLQSGIDNSKFVEVGIAQDYERLLNSEERTKYDVYCYKSWAQVESIVSRKFHKKDQFKAIIAWNAAYNGQWIERNPAFFTDPEFWRVVEEYRRSPQIVLRYRPLPTDGDEVDWDKVCPRYHDFILGPFAPQMVERDETTGTMRNLLVEELQSLMWGSLGKVAIADFGCGPGFLIEHLAGRVEAITGIDSSAASLNMAATKAEESSVRFKKICADIRDLRLEDRFDVIVSSNSVLPRDRRDVVKMLDVMRRHLAPGGRLYAILPSYDTTLYLQGLWRKHYLETLRSRRHADRIVEAFRKNKRANDDEYSYADEGQVVQCYHTPETIRREFHAAGLRYVREPRKVYYPWELANKFDYGNFEGEEEIWDWFVVAEAEPARSARTAPAL